MIVGRTVGFRFSAEASRSNRVCYRPATIQYVSGAITTGMKLPEREDEHSHNNLKRSWQQHTMKTSRAISHVNVEFLHIVCDDKNRRINPWWWRQRQSLICRPPTPYWRGWRLEKFNFKYSLPLSAETYIVWCVPPCPSHALIVWCLDIGKTLS
jgi:hypothetical protein